jgi:hypothetical protein
MIERASSSEKASYQPALGQFHEQQIGDDRPGQEKEKRAWQGYEPEWLGERGEGQKPAD